MLTATVLCAGMVGCAAQRDDSLRLSEELGRTRADASWQQARAAELESRVSQLEQRATEPARTRGAEDDKLVLRLEHLLEINESLLAERAAPVADGPGTAPPQTKGSPVKAAAASTAPAEAPAPSQEQQLRALVEGLRGRPGRLHGTLTREQESALRVLLRSERKLDAENPWPASFY